MFFTKDYSSPHDIILEAICHKVPFRVFRKVCLAKNVNNIEDLRLVLDEPSYKQVSKCVREEFAHQTIWYLAVFSIIMGKDICDLDCEEFDVDI